MHRTTLTNSVDLDQTAPTGDRHQTTYQVTPSDTYL